MYTSLVTHLRQITLRQRLLVVFGVGAAVAVANALAFAGAIDTIAGEIRRTETLNAAGRLHQDVDMMHDAERADVFAALLAAETPETEDDAVALTDITAHVADARASLDALARLPLGETERTALDAAGQHVGEFGDAARVMVLRAATDPVAARAELPAFLNQFSNVEREMDHVTTVVLANADQDAHTRLAQICGEALSQAFLRGGVGLLLGGIPLGLLVVDLLRSLGHVRDVARRLAQGEFSARNPRLAQDELGDIARAFDELAESLEGMVARTDRAATRSRFSAELVEALEMADAEAAAISVIERAMIEVRSDRPMELLLADSSRAHLRPVALHPTAGGPGCGAQSPWDCVAVRRAAPIHFASGEALNACPRLRGRPGGACSATCVPVSFMGRAIGVLHTTGPEHAPIAEEAEARLRALATQAGGRIGTLRVMERTQLQAGTDPLTGLLNRRTLETQVRDLLRARTPYALVMADLDHFKKLNDTFGHEAGDKALRHFAAVLKTSMRPEDLVCRFGGEEFVFVLPRSDAATAELAMSRLRETLAASFKGDTPAFTASIGVADSTHGEDLEEVLRAADAAVYQAKQQGRDRVFVAGTTRLAHAAK